MNSSLTVFDQDRLDTLEKNFPLYAKAINYFRTNNVVLAMSSACTYSMNSSQIEKIAEPILRFLEESAPSNYLHIYEKRVRELMAMQKHFNESPSLSRLGNPSLIVEREAYNITLLASIIFSNHRYEIMAQLNTFLQLIKKPLGHLVSIGMGTGYEIMLAAKALHGWKIEGYDTDQETHHTVQVLLDFFGCSEKTILHSEFPLYDLRHPHQQQYDAIIFSEILEHLQDPLTALKSLRRAVKKDGYIFLTMAVNIAQEDHIYWYENIAHCRSQLKQAGLSVVVEKITPVTIDVLPKTKDREKGFSVGNYIAVVKP